MASFAPNSTIIKLSRSVTRANEKADRITREQQDNRFGRSTGKRSAFQVNMEKVRRRKDTPDEPEKPRHPSPPGITAEELLEEYANRDTAHRFKVAQRTDPEVLLTKKLNQQRQVQLQKIQREILERSAQAADLSNVRKKLWLMRNSYDRGRKQKSKDLDKLSDRCKRKLEDMRKHLGVLQQRKRREDILEHDLSSLNNTNAKWQRQIDDFKHRKKTNEAIIDLTNSYRKVLISKNTSVAYRNVADQQQTTGGGSKPDELIFARDPRYAGSVASCLLISAGMEVHQETRVTKVERRRFFVDELRVGINGLVNNNSVHGREWKFYKNMIARLDERVFAARQLMEDQCVEVVKRMREKSDVMAMQLSRFDNERDLLILFQRQVQTDMLAISHKGSDFLKNFSDLAHELTAKVGFFEARQLFIRDKPSAKLMRRLKSLPIEILQEGQASLAPGHPKNLSDPAAVKGAGDAGTKSQESCVGVDGVPVAKIGESMSAADVTSADDKRAVSKRRKFSLRRSKSRSKSRNKSKSVSKNAKKDSKSRSRSRKLLLFGRKSKSRSKTPKKARDKSTSKRRKFPGFKLPSLSRKSRRKSKGSRKSRKKDDLSSIAADAGVSFTPPATPGASSGNDTTDNESASKQRKKKSKRAKKPKKEKPMKLKKITVQIDKHRKQLAKNHIVPLEYEIYEDGDSGDGASSASQANQPLVYKSSAYKHKNKEIVSVDGRSNSTKPSASSRSILIEPDDDRPDDPLMQDEMKLVDGRTDFNRLRRLHRIRTQAVQKLLKRIELNGVYLLRNVERVMLLACFLTEAPSDDAAGTPVEELHRKWAALVDQAEIKMIAGALVFVKERDTIQ